MQKKLNVWIALTLCVLLASCASPTPAAPTQAVQAPEATQPAATQASQAGTGDAGLKFTGMVATPQNWTEAEIRAMDTIDVESSNSQGQASTYTGVPLAKLIEAAGVQADATTLVFIGSDGFQAEAALAEVKSCDQCIVSFRNKGGFSMVMPGFPSNLQVKGVVEIQAK
jgi:DMSO/TMAO reductase YedYZ molybdopterin-dependent catalytic subunit